MGLLLYDNIMLHYNCNVVQIRIILANSIVELLLLPSKIIFEPLKVSAYNTIAINRELQSWLQTICYERILVE